MKKGSSVFAAALLLSLSLTAACSGRTAAQPAESSEVESQNLSGSAGETETNSGTGSETEASSETGSATETEASSETGSTTEAEASSETGSETETEAPSEFESEPAPAASAAAATEAPHVDVLLTGPPEITLSDSLSSAYAPFTLRSGTGEWSWMDGDEVTSSIACGSAPPDMDPEQAATLDVPDYNRLDSVPYLLSCVIPPDRVLLREWDIQDLGSPDAEPLSETEYSETLFMELKKDRIYELVATWEEEKLEERSFCGEASYPFLTE
ncbi:MAG TPA: hypothetical protein H9700_14900 [Candidatus Eisenbergiella intestinipullorum]|nr:hypothetical protein [Candidatus Eisenbergiella intestinipullorum]